MVIRTRSKEVQFMRYLKTYEYEISDSHKPKVGDYVVCFDSSIINRDCREFLRNNIGQIVKIYPNKSFPDTTIQHIVRYDNLPKRYKDNPEEDHGIPLLRRFSYFDEYGSRSFTNNEIIHFSKDKKVLEDIIIKERAEREIKKEERALRKIAKKYNL
jgi:hypothetical protein